MGIERLTVAAQAAGFSMVAHDDTELGELRNLETERGTAAIARSPVSPRRWIWPFSIRSTG